jgi:hypothetical protein
MGRDMNSVTTRCVFCGAGVVPMVLASGIWDWGCMACGSQNTGLSNFIEGLATRYINMRRPEGKRTIFCPLGLLLVDDWEEL